MPTTQTVHASPTGGSLVVRLVNGHGNDGFFLVALVLAGANTPAESFSGRFSTAANDTFALKTAAAAMDGATLFFTAQVNLFSPDDGYDCFCFVTQDSERLGVLGEAKDKAGTVTVFIRDSSAIATAPAATLSAASIQALNNEIQALHFRSPAATSKGKSR